MILAVASVILVLFGSHMIVLLVETLSRKAAFNQTIYLSGGRYASEVEGPKQRHLIEELDEMSSTFIRDFKSGKVTSSFSCIYIRLYQLYTGVCYDAYLETALQIGRYGEDGEYAKLLIEEPSISKVHCMIYRRGEQILIQDMKSTNHTYVNDHKIEGAVLISHGDTLTLGQCKFQFQCYYQR